MESSSSNGTGVPSVGPRREIAGAAKTTAAAIKAVIIRTDVLNMAQPPSQGAQGRARRAEHSDDASLTYIIFRF
jgi:hypothetical protein